MTSKEELTRADVDVWLIRIVQKLDRLREIMDADRKLLERAFALLDKDDLAGAVKCLRQIDLTFENSLLK